MYFALYFALYSSFLFYVAISPTSLSFEKMSFVGHILRSCLANASRLNFLLPHLISVILGVGCSDTEWSSLTNKLKQQLIKAFFNAFDVFS